MLKCESLTFRRCIEVAVACVVIAVVWGLLLLPTLFYHLPQVSNKRFQWEWSPYCITGAHSIDCLFLFSLQNSTSQNNRTDVTSHSNLTSCSAEVYLGNTCREELLSCSAHMDGDGQINIPSNGNQEKTEEQVTQLSLGLRLLNPSSECMQVAKPFLCLYMFRLCRSGEELLPSPDHCETVRSSACAVEWQRAVAILGMNQLPQCESLPGTSEELNDCLREFKYYYCNY